MGGGKGFGGGGRGRSRRRGRGMGRGTRGLSKPRPENPNHEIEMLRAQAHEIMNRLQALNTRISQIQPNRRDELDTVAGAESHRAESREESQERITAFVDLERCAGCGICIDACPEGAIAVENVAMIDPQKCTGCGSCVDQCPNEAISLPD